VKRALGAGHRRECRWCQVNPRGWGYARRGGSGSQCCRERRAADGGDQVLEFRQPGEAGSDVGSSAKRVDGLTVACNELGTPITRRKV